MARPRRAGTGDAAVRFSLPDLDVFAIDADGPDARRRPAAWPHVGTVLFDLAVNPAAARSTSTNTEARNEVRFEGPGIARQARRVRGHLHEARITVLDGADVVPRHLNKHIDYAVVPSPPGDEGAQPRHAARHGDRRGDGSTLWVAAFGSSAIGVFDTAALEQDTFVPDAADHIAVSGGGPTGLALDEAHGRLYVLTRFDNAVKVVDTAARREIAAHSAAHPRSRPRSSRDVRCCTTRASRRATARRRAPPVTSSATSTAWPGTWATRTTTTW